MIFLIAAAALCMGGIVAYLAREKGRSPITWAIYGTVAAPVALPHILMVKPLDDDDGDVWAEIRNAIQTQSVNDQRPIMSRSGHRPATEPQATAHREPPEAPPAQRREAPLRQTPAPSVSREAMPEASPREFHMEDLNPAPKPDIKPEPRLEPKYEMFSDKRNQSTPTQRAEPSFGPAASTSANPARAASNDFMLNASDRIGAPHTQQAAASGGDMRMRAPLSIDPDADRAQSRPIAGRLFAFGAVAVAIAAGLFVLGPTLARLVPPELAFWAQTDIKDVKSTVPPGITPSGTTSGIASNDALPGGNITTGEAKEVGEAKFGGPIKSDPRAPAYQGSGAAPVDLGQATRNMKPVDVPPEATKSEPKSAPKAVTAPPAPARVEAPKAEPKAVAATPAPAPAAKAEPKRVETAKAEAPKAAAAPKPAPQEDFLSMVNKAIGSNTTPKPPAAASESEQIEQVSAANDLVQSVQVKLRERGYDPGSIDGRTNPKTVQAIREYQQSIGMPPDGLIDVALMERLGVVGKRLQFPTGR